MRSEGAAVSKRHLGSYATFFTSWSSLEKRLAAQARTVRRSFRRPPALRRGDGKPAFTLEGRRREIRLAYHAVLRCHFRVVPCSQKPKSRLGAAHEKCEGFARISEKQYQVSVALARNCRFLLLRVSIRNCVDWHRNRVIPPRLDPAQQEPGRLRSDRLSGREPFRH
jgi:hypothetical protein